MNLQQLCLSCLIVSTISAELIQQQCYKKCDCLKKRLKLNTCPTPNPTHLNIELNENEIVIICKKLISKIPSYRDEDIQSFDARYIKTIDDRSPLTFAAIARKCQKTKAKAIQYAIDLKNIIRISITEDFLDDKNSIRYLRFQKSPISDEKMANLTFFNDDFLNHLPFLKMLVVNHIKISHLQFKFLNMSHIETLDLAYNQIRDIANGVFKPLKNLRHLNLKSNNISLITNETLKGLRHLASLDLSENKIEHLEKNMFNDVRNITYLNINRNILKTIEVDAFSTFSKLEVLDMAENKALTLHERIFSNLTSLVSLNLSRCHFTIIPRGFLQRSHHLDILNISRNAISNIEKDAFQNLTNLKVVDLSHNNLEIMPKTLLQPLKNLQHIFLSFNKLRIFDSVAFWSAQALQTIDMSDNLINTFYNPLGRFKATYISLKNNRIDSFPAFFVYVAGLKQLDLSNNSISTVELMKDLIPKTCNLVIDVSKNKVRQLNFTKLNSEKKTPHNPWKIMLDLSQNRIKCNCLHYQINELRQSQSQTAIVQLTDKEDICYAKYPHDNCPLIYIERCPETCNCYYTRPENAITVDCSFQNLTKFPEIHGIKTDRYEHRSVFINLHGNKLSVQGQEKLKGYRNVTRLDLSDNRLEEIKWLPEKLTELKLNGNRLKKLSPEILDDLRRNIALLNIRLGNNPWDCDCDAIHFQKYLIQFNNFKLNQSEVLCEDTGEPLVYTKICENPNTLKIALPLGLIAFLALASAIIALYLKYKITIKMYLYSKNMCLWCVAEEEIDKEKTYDIFISYSHKDDDFVQKELLPELESGETPFKICIHYRDWLPGEFISTQIVNSVLDSRRTLVILSNNFMESVWGKMEFRTAHLQAINEGMARVIVVLFGELDDNVLDDEIKTYLRTNTYVKWGDPWFWSKLKYALPHSKLKRNFSHQSDESFHLK